MQGYILKGEKGIFELTISFNVETLLLLFPYECHSRTLFDERGSCSSGVGRAGTHTRLGPPRGVVSSPDTTRFPHSYTFPCSCNVESD